ncbi:hypothetical protein GCM10020295_71100 [Streptomyces cinereospinus]
MHVRSFTFVGGAATADRATAAHRMKGPPHMTTASPHPTGTGRAGPEHQEETGPEQPSAAAAATAKLALLVASGATFLAVLDTTVVNIAFSDLRADFPDASLSQLSWVVTSYTVVFAALLSVAGRVADVIGRKKLFLWSTAVFVVASLLSGLATGVPMLVALPRAAGRGSRGAHPVGARTGPPAHTRGPPSGGHRNLGSRRQYGRRRGPEPRRTAGGRLELAQRLPDQPADRTRHPGRCGQAHR